METREKLIRLLPGFFFLIAILGFVATIIFSFASTSLIYLMVPFLLACASRYYCIRKYTYNPKWERIFRITILAPGILGVIAVVVYLVWTSVM